MRRSVVRMLLIVAPLMLVLASAGRAQNAPIEIIGQNNQAFGSVYRTTTSSIGYASTSAGRFMVTGRKNRNVRLTIVNTDLVRTGSTASATLTLSNSDCAYSLDGGLTWTTFSSGTLYTDTTFPNAGGNNSEIHVRVGGSLYAAAGAVRGTYSGTITLSATYLP